jgi:O-antigen/teichoic acid export membrane protein
MPPRSRLPQPEPLTEPAGTSAPVGDGGRTDSIRRNAVFGFATQLTTAAFTAALTVYLVRALGPDDYGVFALAAGIGTLVVLASDFGIIPSTSRFVAESRGDVHPVARVLANAYKLKLGAALPVCGALFALAGPIANAYGNDDLVWPLRAIAIVILGQGMFLLYRGAFIALGRVALTWRLVLFESAAEAGVSVLLVALGGGAAGAAFGRAAGYATGGLVGALLVARLVGRGSLALRETSAMRQIVGYAGPLLVINLTFTLFEQIDVLLIGAIISTSAVGVFEAPLRLTSFLSYGGQALAFAVAPRLARHREEKVNVEAFARGARYLVLLQGAFIAPLLIWATPIADLVLGGGFEKSDEVLRALAPFVFLTGLGTFITLGINYVGGARRRVVLSIVTVIVNAAIDLVLLPNIGVVGGAVGTDVAFTLYVAGHLWVCKQLLDFSLAPLAATIVRSLLAAAVMAAVLAVFGTSSLSVADWLIGGSAGLAAYVGTLAATRELKRAELAEVLGAARALLRRRPGPAG